MLLRVRSLVELEALPHELLRGDAQEIAGPKDKHQKEHTHYRFGQLHPDTVEWEAREKSQVETIFVLDSILKAL